MPSSRRGIVPAPGTATFHRGVAGQSRPRAFGWGSPLLSRAQARRNGPAEMRSVVPSAATQSRASVLGERPPSTAAMIAGQASSVELNRQRTLLEGISRRAYPTAPSIRTSRGSPGRRAGPLRTARPQSNSGISRSASSTFVRIAFALRGAPCGDESRPMTAIRGYHYEQPSLPGEADREESRLAVGMQWVGFRPSQRIVQGTVRFIERNSMPSQVRGGFRRIPVVTRHRGTLASSPYRSLTRRLSECGQ